MKTIIVGDLHLHSRDRLRQKEFHALVEFLKKISEFSKDRLIILGDLFDKSNALSWSDFLSLVSFITKWKEVLVVVGNHDCFFKSHEPCEQLKILLSLPNVVTSSPLFSFWHYYNHQPEGDVPILLAHKDVKELNRFYDEEYAVSMNDFAPYKVVFLGHLHLFKKVGNLLVVGPPYPVSFADQTEGAVVVLEDNKVNVLKPYITAYTRDIDKLDELQKKYRYVVVETEESIPESDRIIVRRRSTARSSVNVDVSLPEDRIPSFYDVLESFKDQLDPREVRVLRNAYEKETKHTSSL